MGFILSKISERFQVHNRKCLFIGLDAAGKTSILYRLTLPGIPTTTIPTVGFNVETITHVVGNHRFAITAWDVGGGGLIRELWRHYYPECNAIVFVVDSNDRARLDECREEIFRVMNHPDLENAVLLVYANKQDLPGAMTPSYIKERLYLEKLQQNWAVIGCCGTTGEGLRDGFDWLAYNSK